MIDPTEETDDNRCDYCDGDGITDDGDLCPVCDGEGYIDDWPEDNYEDWYFRNKQKE